MKHTLFYLLLSITFLVANSNSNIDKSQKTILQGKRVDVEKQKRESANLLMEKLANIQKELNQSSIWLKSYSNYVTYLSVKNELNTIEKELERLQGSKRSRAKNSKKIDSLKKDIRALQNQYSLLEDHSESPFGSLLLPAEIFEAPAVNNPIEIFEALSYTKQMAQNKNDYARKEIELTRLRDIIKKKHNTVRQILALVEEKESWRSLLAKTQLQHETFSSALEVLHTTASVYGKRIDEVALGVNRAVKVQVKELLYIGTIVLSLFIFSIFIKLVIKKYIRDSERYYMVNKIINMVTIVLIFMILLFSYIQNVGYLVTVLGFASAGIAIAMKDWFMSVLGWLVIVAGGSIHVGDRIRVEKDGMIYVGDVMDISFLRITVLEDITLTSYSHNRRAGRIVFIPNNYVFTSMIANYTHFTLKTVWDGIDITITFDSNHKKAIHLVKGITRRYSKGYTDITRKQLNKLRDRYSLKNANVDPRVFNFIEENGIRISSWYLTNAYATLTLRSTISAEIIDAFKEHDDIQIAYPTQRLHMSREKLPEIVSEESGDSSEARFF